MRLYHGSSMLIENPLVHIGRRNLDFGPGFYMTSLREQAVRWANRICIIRRVEHPFLNIYSFDLEAALRQGAKMLSLPEYDNIWLDFIVESRRGNDPWKGYDIIEGGVANDQVIDTVEDYYSGRITMEQALGQLRFAKPTHQMCINSQKIVDKWLSFESGESLNMEVI